MVKNFLKVVVVALSLVSAAFAGVNIVSPTNGSTVGSPVHFVANASGSYAIASMRIYVDGVSYYAANSSALDTYVSVSSGAHWIVVQAWDIKGTVYKSQININVGTASTAPSGDAYAGVSVSSPTSGATVGSPVHFVAKASAANPITAMRIYADGNSAFATSSSSLDTYIPMSVGAHWIVIQAWDTKGNLYKTPLNITVGTTSTGTTSPTPVYGSKTFFNIEQMTGWEHCDVCSGINANGPAAPHSLIQNIASPSMDGNSAQFWLGGTTPYSSALWWKQLGANSGVSHFVYDLYFYVKNPSAAFALEFDVNQTTGGQRYVMGTQCGLNYDKQWDVWDSAAKTWRQTGIACTAVQPYAWNHLVEEFYRANGKIYYVSITLNGVKSYINRSYWPTPVTANDINVAFQMDGDAKMDNYNVWLDQMKLTYW